MKILVHAAALAAVVSASTAQAQDAGKAFQCDLAYRDMMMAMGSLEVMRQSPVKAFVGLHGDGEMIEFAPGETLIHGLKPKSLNVKFLPPHPTYDIKNDYAVEFTAAFDPFVANDETIRKSVTWSLGTCGAFMDKCYRASEAQPEGAGVLSYTRNGDNPELQCAFSFSKEEFEALGN